ncbi:hypothetical protein MRB53_009245 [Persea americana]|uniref:Uncharacterized protein n=1 Tax=Persea americana TaxID=3435 RepID=A0ACC2LP81_PERAE|nr:hypothetical protein MRB53_009245 [Persea americana]
MKTALITLTVTDNGKGLVVDLDEVETPSHFKDELCLGFDFPVPGNYQTCLDLLKLWKDIFTVIVGDEMKEKRPQKETQKGQKEEEIQKESQEEEKDSKKLQKKDDSTEQPQYPSNYNVFFNFVEQRLLTYLLFTYFYYQRKLTNPSVFAFLQ